LGSLIPNMWFWMTPYHPVTWHSACTLPILPLKWPIHIAFIHYSATDQDRSIKFGRKYEQMDFYTNLTFKVQKGRGLGSRDPISKFWDPLNNFWTNWAICLKFIQRRRTSPPACDHKTTHKWAWHGSRDPISKFWDPLYNFWTDRTICFKFGTEMEDRSFLRMNLKMTPKWVWPGSGSPDPISKFWDPL